MVARRRWTAFRRRGTLALAASLFLHSGIWAGVGVYRYVTSGSSAMSDPSAAPAPFTMEVRLVSNSSPELAAPGIPEATPSSPENVTPPETLHSPAAITSHESPQESTEVSSQDLPTKSPAYTPPDTSLRPSPDSSPVSDTPLPEPSLTDERNSDGPTVSEGPDEVIPVIGSSEPPRPASPIQPDYPLVARRRGIEGDVLLEVHVSTRGRVKNVEIEESSGNRRLDSAAVDAVTGTAFLPARLNDRAIDGTTLIRVTFRLQ